MKLNFRTVMKAFSQALMSACLYTVILTFALLLLTSFEGWLDTPAVPLDAFAQIFFISLLIAFSRLLFKIHSLPKFIAYILNYAVLVVGFFTIFVASDKLSLSGDTGRVFTYVILLSVCYLLIAVAAFLLRRALRYLLGQSGSSRTQSKNLDKGNDDYESML